MQTRFLNIFHRHKTNTAAVLINDGKFLNAMLVEESLGFAEISAFGQSDQFLGHELTDGGIFIFSEADIAVGQDSDESGHLFAD